MVEEVEEFISKNQFNLSIVDCIFKHSPCLFENWKEVRRNFFCDQKELFHHEKVGGIIQNPVLRAQ